MPQQEWNKTYERKETFIQWKHLVQSSTFHYDNFDVSQHCVK